MSVIGFDTDSSITPQVLDLAYAHGARFIMLYLKHATNKALVDLIHSKKMAIGLIWETTAERALVGNTGGLADAQAAVNYISKLGSPPPTVAVFWTADFDADQAQQPAVLAYAKGFQTGLAGKFRVGGYANGAIDQAALDAKLVDFTWVAGGKGMRGTVAFLATPYETMTQDVGDKQHLGLPIDIDSDVVNDQTMPWAWWPDNAPIPAPPPILVPVVSSENPVTTAIKALQAALNVTADGVWGPHSQAALDAFNALP